MTVLQSKLWKSTPDWFVTWFNTAEYHELYGERDQAEALAFVHALTRAPWFPKEGPVLELACGAGRHARAFADAGWETVGVDLSPASIEQARFEHGGVADFSVLDMRDLPGPHPWKDHFQAVTLLFTSWGYFDEDADNDQVLSGVGAGLKPGGMFVLDFLNLPRVSAGLVAQEVKNGFHIHRRLTNGWIEKDIQFVDATGVHRHYLERVRAWGANELRAMAERAGLEFVKFYGDYALGDFDEAAPRCILVARKPCG